MASLLSAYILSAYCAYAIIKSICLALLYNFVQKKFPYQIETQDLIDAPKILILIPLLHEEAIFQTLASKLKNVLAHCPNVSVLLITTQREFVNSSEHSLTTIHLVDQFLSNCSEFQNRLFHFTYPHCNQVVAEQLNYGIAELFEKNKTDNFEYFLFYNADSVFDERSINCFIEFTVRYPRCAFQQSSLFLANVPRLLQQKKYMISSFGIYQSSWTLLHEIPRYLHFCTSDQLLRFMGQFLPIHCVMHGLMIPSHFFSEGGTFPDERFGGEDLTIGVILKAKNIPIVPIPILENSDTPPSYAAVVLQLKAWYMSVLVYPFCAFAHLKKNPESFNHIIFFFASTGGIIDSIRWPAKLFLVGISLVGVFEFWQCDVAIAIFLTYCCAQQIVVYQVWRSLPPQLFPKIQFSQKIVIFFIYPITTLIRSASSVPGGILAINALWNRNYIKQKTTR